VDPRTPPRGLPAPWTPPENPYGAAKAALGERLFSEPALSRDRTVACATCHPPEKAYADGKPTAVGIRGQVQARNAPSLLNVAFVRRPFWDGRVASLEEQAGLPITNRTEMDLADGEVVARLAADPAYPPLFREAFGDPAVTFERVRKSIATFERTLLAGDSPFDRWWEGEKEAMPADAVRGFGLFTGTARCSTCHPVRQSYALFTDGEFHATGAGKGAGRDDPGRAAATGAPGDRGKFRTPGLRNAALTAPYMHDGSLATLEEVIDFYDRGGEPHANLDPDIRPLGLTARERRDLAAFLRALTSPVLPGSDDGRALLEKKQYAAARARFLRDLGRKPGDLEALQGLAEASLGTNEPRDLEDARALVAGAEERAEKPAEKAQLAIWVGRLHRGRSARAGSDGEPERAAAHREDAVLAFARARSLYADMDDPWFEGAVAEEECGRPALAEALLSTLVDRSEGRDPDATAARAALRYRRGVAAAEAAGGRADEAARGFFEGAVADARASLARPGPLASRPGESAEFDRALLLARSLHWLGRKDEARAAYLAAIPLSPASRPALTGMASLLSGDPADWTAALEEADRARPDQPQVLYFLGFDRYVRKDLEGARGAFERLARTAPRDAMARVFLGRIARDRGDAARAVALWEEALRLDPSSREAASDWDGWLRARTPGGWADVEALDAGYRRLLAACGDRGFRVAARNNLGLILREVASSWTSRGRGRMQYLADGAPPEALRWMRRCVEVYEEAVAELPDDAAMEGLPFRTRWVYAGVLNDAGVVRHYLRPVQDLDRAERYYLRAFRVTGGAYMDAYFYNLQFLYGFERSGNERRWYRLAAAAKDAVLREDPAAPGGYAPDERKRAAAARDYERLRDLLGAEAADAIEREPLPSR